MRAKETKQVIHNEQLDTQIDQGRKRTKEKEPEWTTFWPVFSNAFTYRYIYIKSKGVLCLRIVKYMKCEGVILGEMTPPLQQITKINRTVFSRATVNASNFTYNQITVWICYTIFNGYEISLAFICGNKFKSV